MTSFFRSINPHLTFAAPFFMPIASLGLVSPSAAVDHGAPLPPSTTDSNWPSVLLTNVQNLYMLYSILFFPFGRRLTLECHRVRSASLHPPNDPTALRRTHYLEYIIRIFPSIFIHICISFCPPLSIVSILSVGWSGKFVWNRLAEMTWLKLNFLWNEVHIRLHASELWHGGILGELNY